MARKHERPSRHETEEERTLRAMTEFRKRKEAEQTAAATDAEIVGPPQPETLPAADMLVVPEKSPETLPAESAGQASDTHPAPAPAEKREEITKPVPAEKTKEAARAARRKSDEDLAVEVAENAYMRIGKKVREMGIRPEDISTEIWDLANASLEKVKSLSLAYKSESDPRKKAKILGKMLNTGMSPKGHITEKIEKAAEELKKKPFGPHSVPTALPIEEQKRVQEMQELLAAGGIISAESARNADVNIDEARTPYEANPDMQEEMDKLGQGTPAFADEAAERSEPDMDEPPIIPNPEDAPEHVKSNFGAEGTPHEWRNRLEDLVKGAKGKLYEAKERLGMKGFKENMDYVGNRVKELDAALAGKAERLAESIGEKYNKLPLWSKIAVGGALTLGLAGTMSVAWPLTSVFGGLIAVQRAAGMMGVFVNMEKHLQSTAEGTSRNFIGKREWYQKLIAGRPEQDRKNMAAIAAMGWTFGMSAAIGLAAKELSEMEWAHRLQGWLGNMLGHQPVPAPEAVQPSSVIPPTASEIPHPAAVAEVPGTMLEGVQPAGAEVPALLVSASPGHGYEYMLKQMWNQLQMENLDASKYAPDSDIRALLEADQNSINKVVHDLAIKNGYFNPADNPADSTSAPINLGSRMLFSSDGAIQLDDAVKAPEGIPTTPAYPPVEAAPAVPEMQRDIEAIREAVPPAPDLADTPPADGFEQRKIPMKETVSTVDLTQGKSSPENMIWRDGSGNPILDGSGNPVRSGFFEQPLPPVEAVPGTVMNQFGLAVPTAEPHIYAGADAAHTFVYGGTPLERANAIQDYLLKNPESVVFGTDDTGTYRIPWHLVEGKVTPGSPMRTNGLFGFFAEWMKPPGPDELHKLIK